MVGFILAAILVVVAIIVFDKVAQAKKTRRAKELIESLFGGSTAEMRDLANAYELCHFSTYLKARLAYSNAFPDKDGDPDIRELLTPLPVKMIEQFFLSVEVAIQWYRKAAELGDLTAAARLALLLNADQVAEERAN
ncbi:MAG: hypothetical protein IJM30_09995 [Thermoguttaceae bacterium]|nr:hypothetical protein [Thermoguttaceae bacterium]